MAAATIKEGDTEQSFQTMKGQLGDADHSRLRLVQLQREADANRSIYETYLTRYKQTLEQESLALPDGRLISQAVPPEAPAIQTSCGSCCSAPSAAWRSVVLSPISAKASIDGSAKPRTSRA